MPDTTVDLNILTRPFPASAIKQRAGGGGKMLDYVEGHTVIHRLNEATGNTWDMTIKSISRQDLGNGQSLLTAHVAITIPGLGTREHIGIQEVRGGGDLVKGCVTDALKKCATLFGVGLELYGPDYEAGETDAPQAPRQIRQAAPQQQAARPYPAASAVSADGPARTDGQGRNLYRLMKVCEQNLGMSKADFQNELSRIGFPRDDRQMTVDQASRAITWFKAMVGEEVKPDDLRPEGFDLPFPPADAGEIPF